VLGRFLFIHEAIMNHCGCRAVHHIGTKIVIVALALMMLALNPVRSYAQEGDGAEAAAAADSHKGGEDSFIVHSMKSAGVGWSLLMSFISIGMVALSVFLLMELRLGVVIPPDFVEEFNNAIEARQFQQAQQLAKDNPSWLAKSLDAALPKLQFGMDEASDAATRKLDEVRASKELIISFMAVIGQLGPLLGLVGTVYGMINSFKKLGSASGNVNTNALAGDISHALVVTLMGVGVAVPAIFFFTFFSKRLVQISTETNNTAADMISRVYNAMRKPAPAQSAAAAPAR
jgi:biopolymer transport protein ExbB